MSTNYLRFYLQSTTTDTNVLRFDSETVATFLLGREPAKYIITKSDEAGERIVTLGGNSYHDIKHACETA